GLGWLHLWIVEPGGFVLPVGGNLQGVMALPRRALPLEVPYVLQSQRLLFDIVLVADDVPRIRRGNAEEFDLHIRDQFAPFDLRQRDFRGVLVLHFVVFTLRRDAPTV